MGIVVPAVLPSNKSDLDITLSRYAILPGISRIQIDVVDGRFASPASWPYTALQELRVAADRGEMLPFLDRIAYEIDLMCLDAERTAQPWIALGATRLTFHAESTTDLPRFLASAREQYGHIVSFGLACNLATSLSLIESNLEQIEYVQFMGIAKIGRQGQPFDQKVFEKIKTFHRQHPDIPIQVDGGVSLENAQKLIALGVKNLVVGSGILRADDPAEAFAAFEALQSPYGV